MGEDRFTPDIELNIVRKPTGRPKKGRVRSADETKNPYRVSRAGNPIVCGNYIM